MLDFSIRSSKAELLDGDQIPEADLRRNLLEIDFINRWLGGFAVSWQGFSMLAGKQKSLTICEVGCGDGANLMHLKKKAAAQGITIAIVGIDIKQGCIQMAQDTHGLEQATWICSDYQTAVLPQKPDIIFSSLFCHHFSNDHLVEQLKWMAKNSRIGFFINDLHRHPFAYYSIKWLSAIFSRSYLLKHDAPLSVARGFTRGDWEAIFTASGLSGVQLRWVWAFRHLITYRHHEG